MKIATHDSITGEQGTALSKLLTPFACTQTKTIIEQYDAGCRFFDIRIKEIDRKYYGAHGLWRTKEELNDIFQRLKTHAKETVYLSITYEGRLTKARKIRLIYYVDSLVLSLAPHIVVGTLYAKYSDAGLTVDWAPIRYGSPVPESEQAFVPLDGRHWQTMIPIPWLWDRLCSRPHIFNDKIYRFVDFL